LLWTWRPAAPARATAVVLGGLAGSGLPLLFVAGRAGSVAALVIAFAVMGLATGPVTGALQTVRQRHAPSAVRSQVFSVAAGLKITCTAAGAALAGTVAGASGTLQFGLAGAVPVLAALAGAAMIAAAHRPSFGTD
jgi:predicted MFS family arabinose efflux permease